MKFLLSFALFCAPFLAFGADLVRTTLNQNGVELAFTADDNDIVRIDGIPQPGLTLLYDLNSSTFYIHTPSLPKTYALPLGTYTLNIPEATLSAGEHMHEYRGKPSRFWQVRVKGKTCNHVFANTKAALESKLDMAHLTRIQTALSYVFGPKATSSCGPYTVPKAHGILMGLPMHSIKEEGGISVVDKIEKVEGPYNKLPTLEVEPLTAAAHVHFLKSMLPSGAQAAFEHNSNHLPLRQQIKALKTLMAQFSVK